MVLNAVVYQCAWFACVLGAAAQRPAIGIAVAAAAVLWHLHGARAPRRELQLIGIAVVAGALFESLLIASGWVRMAPSVLLGSFTPLWMVALWAAFATTLNVSLRTLRRRHLLCALLAAVGAPLAYAAAARLGAMQWERAPAAIVLIAAGWALILPMLMRAALRFDGYTVP